MLVGDGNPVTLPQRPDFLHCGCDHTDVNIAHADAAPERFSCNIQSRATITVEDGSDERARSAETAAQGSTSSIGKRTFSGSAGVVDKGRYIRPLSFVFQTLLDRRRVPALR
jgi:hypothetical protein